MADRKPYLKTSEVKESLLAAIKATEGVEVSDDDLKEQRVSFVYGNSMGNKSITKESARAASRKLRIS